ncbi:hypothetical protein IFM89_038679 [Coptis chinensis]|uniref:AAA+ ATPase domain-containing protein n=1 Tax=Coptis chinensis TaxID=261450 RepID=A0A835I8T0_9MAGN|nr:hypothetical protein IFM89_038679 [Coptis chinensis]
MYARRLICKTKKWDLLVQHYRNGSSRLNNNREFSTSLCTYRSSLVNNSSASFGFSSRWRQGVLRFYSAKGGNESGGDDKHATVKDGVNSDKEKTRREKKVKPASSFDVHAQLGEQDQREWLKNEKMSIESKKKDSPFICRQERFKKEFLRRVVPWEKITVSWDTFPYHVHEHTKNVLVECAASHLKHKKFTTSYGARLTSSSGRILLRSIPGTELYRERLVRALAQDLQVSLLVLDSSILAPYDFGDECTLEDESEAESGEECTSESEVDDENAEEMGSGSEMKSDSEDDDDVRASAEALKKLVPYTIEELEKGDAEDAESASESVNSETVQSPEQPRPLKKGDRVRYIGPSLRVEADNRIILGRIPTSDGPTNAYTIIRSRSLPNGQPGEVFEVTGDRVAFVMDNKDKKTKGTEVDEKTEDDAEKPSIYWIHVQDIERDPETEDWYIALEALSEVLPSSEPIIVYFPDSSQWLSRAVPKSNRKDFVNKVEEVFNRLSGPVVLICGQNKVEEGSKEKEKFTMLLPNLGRLAKLPLSLKTLTEGLKPTKKSEDNELYKLFTNVMCIDPPQDEELLRTFNKQIEDDRRIVISRSNLNEIHKVLEEHELSCLELLHVKTDGVVLTKRKAEQVVGWAKNHYLSSCVLPSIKGERLNLPRESLETAIMRLKEQETVSRKPTQSLKTLAKDEYESNFISAVVAPGEIGVKFDDIGALDDVKQTLNDLVTLPMRRPELFSHGNLLRPCKGILLFGPPGTGKTLLAKALATEAGANFISITGSTLTSKTELSQALGLEMLKSLRRLFFLFATKLAPVIIFVDEVDSLLGARGGAFEHEATRRMRNEFMAAWDGLRSKDSQRILILGATNRPFDLDDAVIRRLPRRIYVDLPDSVNRMKILKIFLTQENLGSNFNYEELANSTEGYSGSDLKNLCIAAAYRPVQELLEEEKKGDANNGAAALRSLNLDDFIQAKSKVGASVAYDATSMNELRKWNEQYGEGGSRKRSPFGF